MNMLCKRLCRIAAFLTEIIIDLLSAFLSIHINLHIEEAFFLCAENSEKTMRCDTLKGLVIIEI